MSRTNGNTCHDLAEELADVVAGTSSFSPDATAHLQVCPQCQRDVKRYKTLADAFEHEAARISVPARRLTRHQIVRSISDQARGAEVPWLRPAIAAFGVVVVFSLGLILRNNPVQHSEPVTSLIQETGNPSVGNSFPPTILELRREVQRGREMAHVPIPGVGMKHYRVRDVQKEVESFPQ